MIKVEGINGYTAIAFLKEVLLKDSMPWLSASAVVTMTVNTAATGVAMATLIFGLSYFELSHYYMSA